MLDTHARKHVAPVIEFIAKIFIKLNFTPNKVTALALFVGIIASICVFFNENILACILLWLSGLLDAVDGQIAREKNISSEWGAFLDIIFDRIVEMSIIVSLGLKYDFLRMNLIFLMCVILLSMTIFLTVGALAANKGVKSFYYQAGVAERSEGFIFLTAMILLKEYVAFSTNLFIIAIVITIIQRIIEARKIIK